MAAEDALICPHRIHSPGSGLPGACGVGPWGEARPASGLGLLVLPVLGGGTVGGDGSAERCQAEHEIQDGQWFYEGFLMLR